MKLFTGIKEGKAYAVTVGHLIGKMLIYMDKTETDYGFLVIPEMKNEWIPKETFDSGLKSGIVEYIERLPRYVRQTSKVQFTQNRNICQIQDGTQEL